MKKEHKFPYEWTLKDANFTKDKGKVFSCFSCGGGSTMGYKLAGFDVIGNCEIDPKMNEVYVENHKPKYTFLEGIQTFKDREDLPAELFDLDILDGSPPCSSFSMAGNREKDWGKKKKFKEGQAEQVLDTLFFDFIDLAKRLQPKVVIAENVKGLLQGDARSYLESIGDAFRNAGYRFNYKLLDASEMGVPQRRERVFFYGIRENLANKIEYEDVFQELPLLNLVFNEMKITSDILKEDMGKPFKGCFAEENERRKNKKPFKYLQSSSLPLGGLHPTITAGYSTKAGPMPLWMDNWLNTKGQCKVGTYPIDYNFCGLKSEYLIGMSVPPVMTAQIASRIWEQWLSKL